MSHLAGDPGNLPICDHAQPLGVPGDLITSSQLEFALRNEESTDFPHSSGSTVELAPKQDSVGACLHDFAATGLHEHRFICLAQYSMFRAFTHNASILGLEFALFADDNSVSPLSFSDPPVNIPMGVPHTLKPTSLQLRTSHHPYLDIIASPSLRDNILVANLSDEQDEQLCMDLHADGSITIWGSQPWSSIGWEISQEFADRWGWLLDGESVRNSNFWRMERGDVLLDVKVPMIDV